MKFATGKTARAIRRREIVNEFFTLLNTLENIRNDTATAQFILLRLPDISDLRIKLIELTEIAAIESNTPARPRRKR